jgi:lysophospholipase L1-like esterase
MWSSRHPFIAFLVLCAAVCHSSAQIVAFGASNVSGFKVEPSQTWPALLEMLLQAKGYNIRVINAGLSGDTTAHMLQRVDTSIPNVIQILLMPLIMLGQNIQGRHSERRAQFALDVNVRAEEEIETVLSHLEYQNTLLITMIDKLGLDMEEPKGASATSKPRAS